MKLKRKYRYKHKHRLLRSPRVKCDIHDKSELVCSGVSEGYFLMFSEKGPTHIDPVDFGLRQSKQKITIKLLQSSYKGSYFHKRNPKFRNEILKHGLLPMVGDSYRLHYENMSSSAPIPCVFVSIESDKLFDTTYDDDIWAVLNPDKYIWEIDMSLGHPYYFTRSPINVDDIILIYAGTGNSTF